MNYSGIPSAEAAFWIGPADHVWSIPEWLAFPSVQR